MQAQKKHTNKKKYLENIDFFKATETSIATAVGQLETENLQVC